MGLKGAIAHVEVNGARIFFDLVGSQLAIDGDTMALRLTLIVLHAGPGLDHTALRPYFDRFADTVGFRLPPTSRLASSNASALRRQGLTRLPMGLQSAARILGRGH